MRRIVTAIATTATAIVLLFSYHTSTNAAATAGVVSALPIGAAPTAVATATSAAAATTVTGDVVQTRWGPVQVAITVQAGRISSATAVQVPSGNDRDAEINGVAVPILNAEAVKAQSAQVDTVSGASVTSGGYQQSLQSAIDQVNL